MVTALIRALSQVGYYKADAILADSREALRLELNLADRKSKEQAALLASKAEFSRLADKIKALLPEYYHDEELKREQSAFEHELVRAEHAIKTGSSKQASIGGKIDSGGPNLYSPERMMLWYAVLSHLEHHASDEEGATPNPDSAMLVSELSSSKGADYIFDKFSRHVTRILPRIGVDKKDCIIRWGEPNSGFWHSKKDPANGQPQDIINFDIKDSLLLGDMVQQVMAHELGHYLYDTVYPPTLAKQYDAIQSLQEKARNGSLSKEEQETLVRTRFLASLYHDIWNAAADNAVDESSHRLSSGDDPRYRYGLLPALLVNFVTYRGQGAYIKKYEKEGALPTDTLEEMAGNPQAVLENLSGTLVQVSSLIHGQMSNVEDRTALLADLPKIGIYTQLLKNESHPEMTGEECFWDLYEKCKRISELTPDPRLMSTPDVWRKARDEMQEERNRIHEEIFAQYAKPIIDRITAQQPSVQDMMDALNQSDGKGRQKKQESGNGEGIPIDIPGGKGTIPVLKPGQPGSHAPDNPGQGANKGKTIDKHEDAAINEANAQDPEAPPAAGNAPPPKIGGLKPAASSSSPSLIAGKASSAVAEINLGDGRTLVELQEDPLFAQAVDEIKDRLYDMMEQFAVPISSIATDATDRLPSTDPIERLSIEAVVKYELSGRTDMPVLFRGDVKTNIPPVGDAIFAIDISGSMSWGPGSRAEYIIKSTALMALGIQAFNEDRARQALPPMGVYVMLWGNTEPTFLGKPYDPDQQEEIILKLDEVLDKVINNKSIEGLHGGTELEGVFRHTLEEYAIHRPDSGEFPETMARGPVLMMIGSDGGVFDMDNVPLSEILTAMPSLTVDTALTDGENSPLHSALTQVKTEIGYQAPVCVDINDETHILPAMLDWMEGRMKAFREAIPWGAHYDVFTEADVTEQAKEALETLKSRDGHASRLSAAGLKSERTR